MEQLLHSLKSRLLTGVGRFIYLNWLETLFEQHQTVVETRLWQSFQFLGDYIRKYATCERVVKAVDYMFHKAKLGLVPRLIAELAISNVTNVLAFLNTLRAVGEDGVFSFAHATSGHIYGGPLALPEVKVKIGNPLSP